MQTRPAFETNFNQEGQKEKPQIESRTIRIITQDPTLSSTQIGALVNVGLDQRNQVSERTQ